MGLFAVSESLSDGLTSFATVVIANIGWRKTYILFGTLFIGVGLIGLSAIKEPVRQRYTYIGKQTQSEAQHAHSAQPQGGVL